MVNFVCKRCGYRFEREKKIGECSYCGETGSIVKEQSANELIEDVEE